jgi:hypothetical protein
MIPPLHPVIPTTLHGVISTKAPSCTRMFHISDSTAGISRDIYVCYRTKRIYSSRGSSTVPLMVEECEPFCFYVEEFYPEYGYKSLLRNVDAYIYQTTRYHILED